MKKSYGEEIESLNNELYQIRSKWQKSMHDLEMAKSERNYQDNDIRVERIPGVDKIVTIYEQDPNIIERNHQLNEELALALVENI